MTDFFVTAVDDQSFDGGDLAAETADGGGLSLREALGLVNSAATGAHAITFDDALAGGTLELTGGELRLEQHVSIAGDLTIDAAGKSRVLTIAAGTRANIDGLDFTGGDAAGEGGGILVEARATLTLTDALVSGNYASAFGGGIAVDETAKLIGRDVRILDNVAPLGGGLGMRDDVELLNAEIGGNFANWGGGVEVEDGSLTLTNATVHGNHAFYAGGGIDSFGGDFTLTFATITGNYAGNYAGGIFQGANFISRLGNSIVAGNSAPLGTDISSSDGRLRFEGANILGRRMQVSGVGAVAPDDEDVAVLSDLGLTVGDLFAEVDLFTGGGRVLSAGGAPGTAALNIDDANPALGAAQLFLNAWDRDDLDGDGNSIEFLPFDARGARRKDAPDIGSWESPRTEVSSVVTTVADVVDADDGAVSLREAIGWLNDGWLTGPITFASRAGQAFEAGGTIKLKDELVVTGRLVLDGDLDGDGLADVTLDGQGLTRVLKIDGGTAELNGLILWRGVEINRNGGTILVEDGSLSIRNSWIRAGHATEGGNIAAINSDVVLVNTGLTGGNARDGGGLMLSNSRAVLTNVSITGAIATTAGGLLAKHGSLVEMTNTTIAQNTSSYLGGAQFIDSDAVIVQSTIASNTASNIYASPTVAAGLQAEGNSHITIANSILAGNVAGNFGVHDVSMLAGAELTVEGTVLTRTAVRFADGAIQNGAGTLLALESMSAGLWGVFATKGEGGRPAITTHDGPVRTVELKDAPGNVALGAGDGGLLPADIHDLDGDGDVAEALPIAANGRAITAAAPDLGAAALPIAEAPSLHVTTDADVVDAFDGLISLREAMGWAADETLDGTMAPGRPLRTAAGSF